jgi:hypothetical protein
MTPFKIKLMLVIPMLILSATIFNQITITNDIVFNISFGLAGSFFLYESIRIIRLKSK